VGPGLSLSPWKAVDGPVDRSGQQPMPGRVQIDLVDPVAVAIVGGQPGFVALGPAPVLPRLPGARDDPGLAHGVSRPASALALERLLQRQVGAEYISGLQRRRLVEQLARR